MFSIKSFIVCIPLLALVVISGCVGTSYITPTLTLEKYELRTSEPTQMTLTLDVINVVPGKSNSYVVEFVTGRRIEIKNIGEITPITQDVIYNVTGKVAKNYTVIVKGWSVEQEITQIQATIKPRDGSGSVSVKSDYIIIRGG